MKKPLLNEDTRLTSLIDKVKAEYRSTFRGDGVIGSLLPLARGLRIFDPSLHLVCDQTSNNITLSLLSFVVLLWCSCCVFVNVVVGACNDYIVEMTISFAITCVACICLILFICCYLS
jgi:hypothetical protein